MAVNINLAFHAINNLVFILWDITRPLNKSNLQIYNWCERKRMFSRCIHQHLTTNPCYKYMVKWGMWGRHDNWVPDLPLSSPIYWQSDVNNYFSDQRPCFISSGCELGRFVYYCVIEKDKICIKIIDTGICHQGHAKVNNSKINPTRYL